jgi:uncharacterized protein YjiS (DUF1127 family)
MVLQLSFNDFLQLRGAKGAAIEVLDGRVWITEDGRGGDLFLDSGRSYRVSGAGLVVVGAEDRLHYARVQVRKPSLGFLAWMFNKLAEKRRQLETRRQLSVLSDRMLEDIGLRRDQIP